MNSKYFSEKNKKYVGIPKLYLKKPETKIMKKMQKLLRKPLNELPKKLLNHSGETGEEILEEVASKIVEGNSSGLYVESSN